MSNVERILYCSFCGESQHKVDVLIAGPSIFICNDCVDLCVSILRERRPEKYCAQRDALVQIIEMNRQHAEDQYGDANKAEAWGCVSVARRGLKGAKP